MTKKDSIENHGPDKPERYVPEHSLEYFDGVTSQAIVIIPVINEGNRLHSLLERMDALEIAGLADIVIVDGGSTDGSVDSADLRRHSVRGLLVYSGGAGLSAQLQVAYAFALDLGYESIITIDGNDKDDPEAIPRFLEKLNDGFDFVQGSRFLSGGFHENTPLSRLLAVRLIHAPILSIASGYRWTDTTQGFRGYSSALLLDPRIAIFRDVFTRYSLLMHLTYIAPTLKYRVVEIGSRRDYPRGKTPTKISLIRGNLLLFSDLIKVVFGRYTCLGPSH